MAGIQISLGNAPAVAAPVLVQPAAVAVAAPDVAMQDPNAPWPPVLTTPIGQTVCNYVSYCRNYHSAGFLIYVLLLVAVIVLVWLAQNGTLSLMNSAIGVTIAVVLCIVLMFIHWYWFLKGVIPECSGFGGLSVGGYVNARAATRSAAVAPVAYVPVVPAAAASAAPVAASTEVPAIAVAPAAAVAVGTTAQAGGRAGGAGHYSQTPFYF